MESNWCGLYLIKQSDLSKTIIKVSPLREFYYRVFPTLEEQECRLRREWNHSNPKKEETKFKDFLLRHRDDLDFEQYDLLQTKKQRKSWYVFLYTKTTSIGDGRYDISKWDYQNIFNYSKGHVGLCKYHDCINILAKTIRRVSMKNQILIEW